GPRVRGWPGCCPPRGPRRRSSCCSTPLLDPLTLPIRLRVEPIPADLDAGEGEERLVDVTAAIVADLQPAILVDRRDRSLDHVAVLAQSAAVRLAPLGEHRLDPHPPPPVLLR